MRVVVAPDSYKGTLSATDAAHAMAQGLRRVPMRLDIDMAPMADGGEGTLEILQRAVGGAWVRVLTTDAHGQAKSIAYVRGGHKAMVELAAVATFQKLIGPVAERDQMAQAAHTYGVGQVIVDALERGAEHLVLTLGGSSTTDGGYGLLRALGAQYRDADGNLLSGRDARELSRVREIDLSGLHPGVRTLRVELVADVQNPLLGPRGTTAVYGRQKGLMESSARTREGDLATFALLLEQAFGQSQLALLPGCGAAGGAGLPLLAMGRAQVVQGAQYVGEAIGLPQRIAAAQFVLTGEGCADASSSEGKVPWYVASLAHHQKKLCALVAGSIGEGYEVLFAAGLTHMVEAAPTDAADDAARLRVQQGAYQVALEMMRDLELSRRKEQGGKADA